MRTMKEILAIIANKGDFIALNKSYKLYVQEDSVVDGLHVIVITNEPISENYDFPEFQIRKNVIIRTVANGSMATIVNRNSVCELFVPIPFEGTVTDSAAAEEIKQYIIKLAYKYHQYKFQQKATATQWEAVTKIIAANAAKAYATAKKAAAEEEKAV